jgi:hypothetical protein
VRVQHRMQDRLHLVQCSASFCFLTTNPDRPTGHMPIRLSALIDLEYKGLLLPLQGIGDALASRIALHCASPACSDHCKYNARSSHIVDSWLYQNRAKYRALCRLAKFQGVNTLTIFVGSNQGDKDTTQVSKIVVSGTASQRMNVADIKKAEDA